MHLTIDAVPHHALGEARRAEIVALCSAAYEEPFEDYLPLLTEATHLLGLHNDVLVAHAAWLPRIVRYGTDRVPLQCAYVEAVATQPALQRRGFGTALLRAIIPRVQEFDVAMLSPSDEAFYARLGWESWRGPLSYVRDGEVFETPDDGVMIHRLHRTPATLDLDAPLEAEWRPVEVW